MNTQFATKAEKSAMVSEEVIYQGICREEGNKAMRTYHGEDQVLKADHAVYIPTLLRGVTNECYIDIENFCGSINGIQITSCQPVLYGKRQGTTIYFNEPKN